MWNSTNAEEEGKVGQRADGRIAHRSQLLIVTPMPDEQHGTMSTYQCQTAMASLPRVLHSKHCHPVTRSTLAIGGTTQKP